QPYKPFQGCLLHLFHYIVGDINRALFDARAVYVYATGGDWVGTNASYTIMKAIILPWRDNIYAAFHVSRSRLNLEKRSRHGPRWQLLFNRNAMLEAAIDLGPVAEAHMGLATSASWSAFLTRRQRRRKEHTLIKWLQEYPFLKAWRERDADQCAIIQEELRNGRFALLRYERTGGRGREWILADVEKGRIIDVIDEEKMSISAERKLLYYRERVYAILVEYFKYPPEIAKAILSKSIAIDDLEKEIIIARLRREK
ncbi:MAG: hypothetical protein DRH04_01885, partial [Deltaproteobacteria bacterium]